MDTKDSARPETPKPGITGYRELSRAELDLINEIKAHAEATREGRCSRRGTSRAIGFRERVPTTNRRRRCCGTPWSAASTSIGDSE